ncbi:MAG: glycoside hydrolase [Candidatus Marinimicrobia bacterium]|nr:glycoside hydrolase [Candidatus Neomarinimicrobiota bacterium]MCF7830024.1 glycoside hydrolase [Candidatus Neomarinimicrobiota bacterium]MCF7881934.1 glycoside hydrolase [Candidatus Neomarinimicrobiota bacterium]
MTRSQPLYVIFQWHMHQPFYKDQSTGEYLLPWSRLHTTKDYTDMAWHLERHPEVKGVVNFVPSLLKQIEEYNDFDTVSEKHLNLTQKPADALTAEEQFFLLQEFFMTNEKRIINRSERYTELLEMRGDDTTAVTLNTVRNKFKARDFRDLQVWFLLGWTGEQLRSLPEVQSLVEKDENFTEADKKKLLEIHETALRNVLEQYDALQKSGQIEITGTPYAHPILPLLIDSDVARISMPGVHLPQKRFRHPEEARKQIHLGKQVLKEIAGWEIAGMWPSEGSVSEATAELLAEQGIQWISTDSNVLARSLSRNTDPAPLKSEDMYQPYRFSTEQGDMTIFFRDQGLSDLIGFDYADKSADAAVTDFMGHLHRIDESLPDDGYPYVAVITMDGENAWEHFEENGKPFFDALYTSLAESERIQTTTFREQMERAEVQRELQWLHPGSWIGADYHIWIGHPEKNAAWDALNDALNLVEQKRQAGKDIPEKVEQAILQAEGSDWFWWYGHHNNSDHDEVFDLLFCNALRIVYEELDASLPPYLKRNITEP